MIEVAPLLVATWYGSSMPCSISAIALSAVITRGLEMILPVPSASSADSSRFRKRLAADENRLTARLPAAAPLMAPAGRLMNWLLL